MNGGPWNDERVTILRKLWLEGKSASEIARALDCGLSRNACIGKAHRLGLTDNQRLQPTRPRLVAAPRPKPAPKPAAVAAPKVAAPPALRVVRPAPSSEPKPATLMNLKRSQCRWPIADGSRASETLFCGAARAGDETQYCAAHDAQSRGNRPKHVGNAFVKSLRRHYA